MNTFDLSLLTSANYRKAAAALGKVIIPVASIEILGTHGPLGADWMVANVVIPKIASQAQALFAPAIPYGDTLELPQDPGTIHVPQQVLEGYYMAIARSFLRENLIKHLIFVNFHSLNNRALDAICRQLAKEDYNAYVIDWWKTVGGGASEILSDKEWGTGHGAEMITSVLMHVAPEVVRIEEHTNELPLEQFSYYKDHLPGTSSPFAAYGTFADYCNGGAWGDISHATAEKGKALIEKAVTKIVEFINSVRLR